VGCVFAFQGWGRSLLLFLKFGAIDALHKARQRSVALNAPAPSQPRSQPFFQSFWLDASPFDGSSKSHARDARQHQVLSQRRFDLKAINDQGGRQAPFQAVSGAWMTLTQIRQNSLQSGFSLGSILAPDPLELLGGPAPFVALQMGHHAPSNG
jgi:hypothetical protein